MREYNAKNADVVRAQDRARLVKLKENPDAYAEFRKRSNKANQEYASRNREKIKEKWTKRNRELYTPEVGKMLRDKYALRYSTKVSIKSARKRAEEKGLPFDLTPEWYDEQFEKGCAVTGLKLDPNGSKTPWTAHVDKIVPSLGYIRSNCRLVCACYNLAKKHWSDADVERMARALIEKLDA